MIFFCHLRPDDCDCISRPCRWGREAAGSEPSQVCFVLLQQQDLGVERQGQLDAMVRFQGIERDGVGQVRGSREVLVLILWGHGGTAPEDFPVCPESRTAQASRGVLLSTEPNVLANLFLWHLQQAEHHRTHWTHIGHPWAHHPWTSPGGSSLHLGLSGTVGEEVPEIAGWPHAGHGNSRVPQIILHLPLADTEACLQSPSLQRLDVLQQGLSQVAQQLSLRDLQLLAAVSPVVHQDEGLWAPVRASSKLASSSWSPCTTSAPCTFRSSAARCPRAHILTSNSHILAPLGHRASLSTCACKCHHQFPACLESGRGRGGSPRPGGCGTHGVGDGGLGDPTCTPCGPDGQPARRPGLCDSRPRRPIPRTTPPRTWPPPPSQSPGWS